MKETVCLINRPINGVVDSKYKIYTREDVIHALAYACGEAKKGLTHAQILINYKEINNL